jgi:hypothetical protein
VDAKSFETGPGNYHRVKHAVPHYYSTLPVTLHIRFRRIYYSMAEALAGPPPRGSPRGRHLLQARAPPRHWRVAARNDLRATLAYLRQDSFHRCLIACYRWPRESRPARG